MKITDSAILKSVKEKGLKKIFPGKVRITVSEGTCGIGNGADEVYKALETALQKQGVEAHLTGVGCFGFCAREPLVAIFHPGQPLVFLEKVTVRDADNIVKNIAAGRTPTQKILGKIEEWDHISEKVVYGRGMPEIPSWDNLAFFKGQKKIVLRNCGLINPEDIEEFIAVGGYGALDKALQALSPEQIVNEVKKSKLRGRGGAGFPTGRKWEIIQSQKADCKYIICNADEGDPGAFMNRNEIESDPHSLLEGMIIGAYAMEASKGIIYIRAEYPLAVKRLKKAIGQAREYGLLGENILGTGFDFDLSIVEGAGAFVCGEETSLIESIEGKAGRPRARPPYPAELGLWGKPTNINNVETWFNIPVIIAKGGEWFARTGTDKSAGTKVFSLVGKLKNTGLVELHLGSMLNTIVNQIGQASRPGKKIKGVLTGGPSGGCIPAERFDTAVDYESLAALGAIMGSGGMVVMDEDNCLVDMARYFLEFTTAESCGKCVPCREGLYQALKIVRAITDGQAGESDLEELETLGKVIKDSAFCGLGQTGPNPVLTTLKYFRGEYEEHLQEKRCRAGICSNLFLSPCENSCPLHMNIPGFLQLFKENRLADAFQLILQDNPLPATTGRICHHPCENRCRRKDIDQPVGQREVHGYIADTIYRDRKDKVVLEKLLRKKLPATGKKIAIVGSGPAGLTAAFYLVRLGHKIVVYESHSQPGGMLRNTIPEYRLPKAVLDKEIGLIKALGVKFIFHKNVGVDIPLVELEKKYAAIFLAIGAQKEISLGITGENLTGVFPGLEFLHRVNLDGNVGNGRDRSLQINFKNRKVIVIGGGNVAIDAARSARRLSSEVSIVYRREKSDLPANREDVAAAELEGVEFVFLAAPKNIIGDAQGKVKAIEVEKMVPGEFDLSGRRKPLPTGKTVQIFCDSVILAIGERVDSDFIKAFGLKVKNNATVEADRFTYQTNTPKIYAGGDLVTGPGTVSEAMAVGKKVAEAIDRQLCGAGRFDKLFAKFNYENTIPLKPEGGKRQKIEELSLKLRKNNFKEVSMGFSEKETQIECRRCLRCDVKEGR